MPRALQFSLLCCVVLGAGASVTMAADSGTIQPPTQAYSVLQRLGLLQQSGSATVAPAAGQAPVPGPVVQPVVESVPVALPAIAQAGGVGAASASISDPLSRAYDLLRAKGLLPGGPVNPPAANRAAAPQRTRPGAELVVVDKSERKLFLFKGGRPYREYRISLGTMPNGPKQRKGDLRTPEGEYTLDWRNPRSRFYKSIHISYPNEQDRVRAQQQGVDPGGNIMIHGEHYLPSLQRTLRRARSPKDWTEGCIAMNNEQIDEIWTEVADGTPIHIRP